ncbi:MAG: protein translocase subunit SecF [Actinobacteria bacterium]|nr:protein translocase subunit SecF [Actinomycetota bacterium]MCG2791316.1 protein translocase subunit SecF [Actinomycetes bacterium]
MRFKNYNFDFIGKSKILIIISLVMIIAGIAGYFIQGGFNLGIDFLGGSLMEVEFTRDVDVAEVRSVMNDIGFGNAILQRTESNRFIIRTKAKELGVPISTEEKNEILDSLNEKIGTTGTLLQDRIVDPFFGKQITKNAFKAIGISFVGILIYVWIRFELRFGAAAILALVHDVLVTLGVYAILNREINTSTIAAILTIIGYSINDTIVVFDRIRENTPMTGKLGYTKVVNDSINVTLSRSINTSLTTLIPIILLLILGTAALKDFALALTVGIVTGTYSSMFIASPIVVAWNNRFPKYKK